VNVALPFLQQNLNASAIGVQWVVEAYSLFLSALLLVGGSLGDRFGRRRVFCIGVALFALASIGCGLAGDINQLILARAIQGIGGALLVPGSLAIISASFDEQRRGQAIGTWSGFSAITTAVGPVFGGWLIEHVSWRAVFFINVPIALTVIVLSLWHVPESRDESETGPLDWLGALLATGGLAGIVFGLIESSRVGFNQPFILISLAAGGAALALFVFHEARARNPLFPLRLFFVKDFTGANILTLLLYAGLSAVLFFLALNLIQVQRYAPTAAGAAILPFVLIMFSLSRWSGGLVDRLGARLPLTVGPLIAALGFAMFAWAGRNANYWTTFFPAVVVMGLGMAISVAPLTTTVMGAVSEQQSGIASGINNTIARTSGLLAIAVFGVVMLQVFGSNLNRRLAQIQLSNEERQSLETQRVRLTGMELPGTLSPTARQEVEDAVADSFISGFRLVMAISAALAIMSALSSWLLIGQRKEKPG
jgi:EmrB/QacA subfamily drug resistance transporter